MQRSNDTVSDIWDRSWRCMFSRNLTTPIDHIERVGTYVTGDDEVDRQQKDEIIDTYITINDMVEMHRKGIRIDIYNYDDVADIYKIIERHILAWKRNIEECVNIGDAPLDDLIAMDAFATAIYTKARYVLPDNPVSSTALNYMRSLTGGVIPQLKSIAQREEDKLLAANPKLVEEKMPERISHESVFKGIAAGMRRW